MPPTSALAPFVGRPGLGISVSSGLVYVNNAIYALYGSFVPLVGNSLNFVYLTLAPSVAIAVNQSGFPVSNCLPIGLALCDNNSVKDLVDYRPDWFLNAGSGGGGGGGGAPTVASVTLIAQNGSVGPTLLYNVPPGGAGMYAVYADVLVTQAGSAGTVSINVTWNNGTTVAGLNSAPFLLSSTGEQSALLGNFISAPSQQITFSTTVVGAAGSPLYQLALRLVYLG
jgi:hypothetical protein